MSGTSNKSYWRSVALAVAVLVAIPWIAAAHDVKAGRLTGVVKDGQGAAFASAEVVATNDQTGAQFRAFADRAGTWTMTPIPAGTYTVSITAPGTVPAILKKISVTAGGSASADVVLKIGLSETVVVTASRIEQLQVNAPAPVTIVNDRRIAAEPTQNYADIMRGIPGVNVVQMSARDFNVTPRGATNVPASSQLVMIDGRPINQDYYGYVAWDFLPTQLGDVKQIEVVSGASSAVWGPYAMNGVVNILTKSPREAAGTTVTMGGGSFDRSGGIATSESGNLGYASVTHAQAVNDRWAFRAAAGYYQTDAYARPSGTVPNQYNTPYPSFTNYGTKQPKLDGRVDYDSPDGRQHVSISGGYAGTGGTFHTGLGPFRLEDGAYGGYTKVDYRRGGFTLKSFVNVWGGQASSLLAVGPLGAPLLLDFSDRSWDIDLQQTQVVGVRHRMTYGGNYRHNWASITMAPGASTRDQGGVYVEDEIFLSDQVRWLIGARVDKYNIPENPVFSPRTALMIKPTAAQTFRVSYSRAYRAPSLFQNYLDTTVVNAMNLGLLNPALAGQYYYFAVNGKGTLDLDAQTMDAYEASYSAGMAQGRAHAYAAFYLTDSRNDMILTQTGSYSSAAPPPHWPLPAMVLDGLIAANAFGPGLGLPSVLSFQNLGEVRNKGFEVSVDAQPHRAVSLFTNYSWQAEPKPKDFPLSKINLPPAHRFNAGVNLAHKQLFGNVTVGYTSRAFFRDVLDATYAGWTRPFTIINAGVGVRLGGERVVMGLKVRNLTNEPVQNHLFGDLLRRQIVAELRLQR